MGVFLFCLVGFCFVLNYLLPQGQQPANSHAERECSVFPGSSTRRLIRQDSSELVTLNPFYRRETNANKMQFPSSGVSARCSAIKFNYRVELKPSSLHSQRDAVLYKIEIGHGSSKISCGCLFASWLHWRLKCKECWLLSPNTLADLGYRLVPPTMGASSSMDMEGAWDQLWGLPPSPSSKQFPPGAALVWAMGRYGTWRERWLFGRGRVPRFFLHWCVREGCAAVSASVFSTQIADSLF